jgi:hypothetical protein
VDYAAALIERFNTVYRAMVGTSAVSLPKITHEDGKQFFLDLQPLRDVWRAKDAPGFAAASAYERDWVAALWMAGFLVTDPADDGEWYVWGTPDAAMWLVNPTDRTRNFTMSFTIGVDADGPFEMNFSGLVGDSFTLDTVPGKDESDTKRYGQPRSYSFALPPGRSFVRIRCQPPEYFSTDTRNLCYFIKDFKLTEK